jgi:hypothetical protein
MIDKQELIDRGIDITIFGGEKRISELNKLYDIDTSQEAIDEAIAYFDSFLKNGHSILNRGYGKPVGVHKDWILFEKHTVPQHPHTLTERWADESQL